MTQCVVVSVSPENLPSACIFLFYTHMGDVRVYWTLSTSWEFQTLEVSMHFETGRSGQLWMLCLQKQLTDPTHYTFNSVLKVFPESTMNL